jgi:hypothetical protein
MFITSPNFQSSDSYETWRGDRGREDSTVIQALQPYCTASSPTGVFGSHHDSPYVRKQHLGKIIYKDTLTKTSLLTFNLMVGGQTSINPAIIATPNGSTIFGSEWTMTLVFFPLTSHRLSAMDRLSVAPAYYDFHKLWLCSNARSNYSGSTPANIELPMAYSTHGQMMPHLDQWFMNIEFMSPVFYANFSLRNALTLTTTWGNPSNSAYTVLCTLNRSFRTTEQGHYGVRYSIRPTARDQIGVPAVPPDGISVIKLQIRDTSGVIINGALIGDWACCLTYYRQYE